jgi:hypothetical protein
LIPKSKTPDTGIPIPQRKRERKRNELELGEKECEFKREERKRMGGETEGKKQ